MVYVYTGSRSKAKCTPGACGSFIVIFMLLGMMIDSYQDGQIHYSYTPDGVTYHSMTNVFDCRILKYTNQVVLYCNDDDNDNVHDICNLLDDVSSNWKRERIYTLSRVAANPAYDESYPVLFLNLMVGGTVICWCFTVIMFGVCRKDKYDSSTYKWKICAFIWAIHVVLFSVGLYFAIAMSVGDQLCKIGLYGYLENEIGDEIWNDGYEWKNMEVFRSPFISWYFVIIGSVIILIVEYCMIRWDYQESKRFNFHDFENDYDIADYNTMTKQDMLRVNRKDYESGTQKGMIM